MSDPVHHTPVLLLVLLPLLGAAVSLVEKSFPRSRVSQFTAPVTLLAAGILLVRLGVQLTGEAVLTYALGGWPEPFGIWLYLDGLSWLGLATLFAVSLPILLYAGAQRLYSATFYFLFQTMIAAMAGLLLSGDLFNIFVFFEILALCSYVLIAYLKKPRAIVASLNYLLVSTLGIFLFLVGVFILYRLTGVLSVRGIVLRLPQIVGRGHEARLALVCLIVGIGVRTAFVPFHAWLADAHAFAPHPVSAVLSGLMIKVSFIVLWRILSLFPVPAAMEAMVVLGATTALLGVVWAMAQNDAKRLLAYHSISQMGYIVAAFGLGTVVGRIASFYHLVNHALFKSLLFLSVGALIDAAGERDLRRLKGQGAGMLWLALPFAAAALAIAGLPPFNGYASKQFLSAALREHWVYPMIWITGVGTVASFAKLSMIFCRVHGTAPRRTPPGNLYPALWLLAAACLATGLAPGFLAGQFARLLGPIGAAVSLPSVYAPSGLLGTLLMLVTGGVLYVWLVSPSGLRAGAALRRLASGLHGALLLVVAGFLLLYFAVAMR